MSNSACFRFARSLSRSVHLVRDCLDTMTIKLAAYAILGWILHYFVGLSCLPTTAVVFGIYVATGGYNFLWILYKTLLRDISALYVLIKLTVFIKYYTKTRKTIPKLFTETVRRHPNKPCFLFESTTWTFQDVENYSNQVANYFLEAGFQQGDVIGIFLENRPEYVCYWLGLAKIGAVAALINFNQRDDPLVHSISCANSKGLIFGGDLSQAIKDIRSSLPDGFKLYCTGAMATNDLSPLMLDAAVQHASSRSPPPINHTFTDKLLFVYTSGTTGLPKAAIISHTRFFYLSYGVNQLLRIKPDDVLYDMLPLYHSAGGVIGIGQALITGLTIAIRRKFSASQYWDDCVKYKCTVAQYIGEICRYLLAQPVRPTETQHKVRLMFGNGLRPQIWQNFQDRFGVKMMGEFYGATEGNCSVINTENKVGAVGFTTRIAPSLYPITLIRVDEATGELMRDKNGLCIPAEPGQPGELVGKIIKGNPLREFDGYVSKSASDKKIATDVFRKGDRVFLTGDVLVMDDLGYMFFRDRTGDTFRWRGENVSTSEVEAVISNILKLQDAVVYGVEIPGVEGRAGMAAIVDDAHTVNLQELNKAMQTKLPAYARPIFIRISSSVDMTGTFKLKKTDLREDGFNPSTTTDPIYYLNSKSGQFEHITEDIYQGILKGALKL